MAVPVMACRLACCLTSVPSRLNVAQPPSAVRFFFPFLLTTHDSSLFSRNGFIPSSLPQPLLRPFPPPAQLPQQLLQQQLFPLPLPPPELLPPSLLLLPRQLWLLLRPWLLR